MFCALRSIQISGNYGVRLPLPTTAGNEGLGRVVEVNGAGVTEVVVDMRHLITMPEGDLDQLCMMMVDPATAQLLLTEFVDLKPSGWMI